MLTTVLYGDPILKLTVETHWQIVQIIGFSLLVFQLSLYPYLERILGPIPVARISAASTKHPLASMYVSCFNLFLCNSFFVNFPMQVISILLLSSYPFIAMLSGLGLSILINCASIMKNVFSVSVLEVWTTSNGW